MKAARYQEQMPFVGTHDQYALITAASVRVGDSKAAVERAAINVLFGLQDESLPAGVSVEEAVERVLDVIRHPERYVIVLKTDVTPAPVEPAVEPVETESVSVA